MDAVPLDSRVHFNTEECKMKKRYRRYEEVNMPLEQREFFSLQAYKRAYREYLDEEQTFDEVDDLTDYLKRGGFQYRKNPDAKLKGL